ncbi:hypothetical protein [Spirosoma sp. 48-14]|uniref:pPIWI_RE_Z domain-containing protein n=1 Tax=Spirosoma sp. 48-14 TaxID=1895854 RepID=UPI000AF66BFA|nr:hypothetical protein [Spirosoma sp. 48-14]
MNTARTFPYSNTLCIRQLIDVELGLFLLKQINPESCALSLPDILQPEYKQDLSPKQSRILHRGRILLYHFSNKEVWQTLLVTYSTSPKERLVFDINPDSWQYSEKFARFSRNRISVLRRMLI